MLQRTRWVARVAFFVVLVVLVLVALGAAVALVLWPITIERPVDRAPLSW